MKVRSLFARKHLSAGRLFLLCALLALAVPTLTLAQQEHPWQVSTAIVEPLQTHRQSCAATPLVLDSNRFLHRVIALFFRHVVALDSRASMPACVQPPTVLENSTNAAPSIMIVRHPSRFA